MFAHSNNLKDFAPTLRGYFQPVGQTDSELAGLLLPDATCAAASRTASRPRPCCSDPRRAAEIRGHGNSTSCFPTAPACSPIAPRLAYIVQRPFDRAHLKDQNITVDFRELTSAADQRVYVMYITDRQRDLDPIGPRNTLVLFIGRRNGGLSPPEPVPSSIDDAGATPSAGSGNACLKGMKSHPVTVRINRVSGLESINIANADQKPPCD